MLCDPDRCLVDRQQPVTPVDLLRQDYLLFAEILAARRAVTVETLPAGAGLVWKIYLTILEDALSTLRSLLDYLDQ
jgi:hypothetical protein